MISKIALEEHFALPETLADSTRYASAQSWSLLEQQLLDLDDYRVSQMDAHGIAYAILSLNSPAIQAIADRSRAIDRSPRQRCPRGRRRAQAESIWRIRGTSTARPGCRGRGAHSSGQRARVQRRTRERILAGRSR